MDMNRKQEFITEAVRLYEEEAEDSLSARKLTSRLNQGLRKGLQLFTSRDSIVIEVTRHQIGPVNEERIAMLDEALKRSDGAPLPLEEIVNAITLPMAQRIVESAKGLRHFHKGLSRWFSESPELKQRINEELFEELHERFLREFQRTLPDLTASELERRYYVAGSSLLGGFMRLDQYTELQPEKLDEPLVWEVIQELQEFICSGFGRSPGSKSPEIQCVCVGDKKRSVDIRSICSIRADDNYTHVHYWGGGKTYVRQTMSEWERELPSGRFIRIHRSSIINRQHIAEIRRLQDDRLSIKLRGEQDAHLVSRRRASKVAELLEL